MLIVLGGLAVILFFFIMMKIDSYNDELWKMWEIVLIVVFIGIWSITLLTSYATYVDCRSFIDRNSIDQYVESKDEYESSISYVVPSLYVSLEYNGYATEMSSKLNYITEKVDWYNETITSKRILKNGIVFSWLIVAPDPDMQIITVKDVLGRR